MTDNQNKNLPQLSIVYGSATGNAEYIAKDLAAKAPPSDSFYSSVVCCEMDQYKKKCQKVWETDPVENGLRKHPVVAITSTTGNGDAPENAGRFVRWIKRKTTAPTMPFRHCAFAVLALGDTNYDQFCATGKLVDRKMDELGGSRAAKVALADEATGLEDVVDPWVSTVLESLRNACAMDDDVAATEEQEEEKEKEEEIEQEPVSATAPTKRAQTIETSATEEEKKEETLEALKPSENEPCLGLRLLRSVAAELGVSPVSSVPPDSSAVTSLTAAVSSCEISSEADDEDDEDDAPRYHAKRPYRAPILGARYLTNTSTAPAAKVAEALSSSASMSDAAVHYENAFDVATDPRDARRVVELTLGLPDDDDFVCGPGDSIGLWVDNACAPSFRAATSRFDDADHDRPLGNGRTAREALSTSADLTGVVKPRALARLAARCANEEEAAALRRLADRSSPEGRALYDRLVARRALDVGAVLELFPSCRPGPRELIEACDRATPRYYSVVDRRETDAKEGEGTRRAVRIAFSVVDFVAETHPLLEGASWSSRRGGLATRWLEVAASGALAGSAAVDVRVSIFPKPTLHFRPPSELTTPLVLVGPGTGVAPFLGFLSDRRRRRSSESEDAGAVTLFFGCRWPDHDRLYRDELDAFVENGTLDALRVAFSRVEDETQRCYVQHTMREEGRALVDLVLNRNASVYICGDGNSMARDVQKCLAELLDEHGNLGEDADDDGASYVEEMKKRNKLLLDIWTN